MKTAVILVGGRGKRLGSITEKIPKPLVLVHGQPILWYTFLTLYNNGFRNFIFPTGYRGEMISMYLNLNFGHLGCNIHCIDTGEKSSIAERISQVSHLLPEREDFFLANGDTIFDFDIGAMYKLHVEERALVTLASVEVVSSWGLIHLLDGKMVGFDRERRIRYIASDRPNHQGRIYSGMAYVNKIALRYMELGTPNDFEYTVYPGAIKDGRGSHFELKGTWFPIDTPKDLEAINGRQP
jgi:NDP-sugar pyrophosphorylase family protein